MATGAQGTPCPYEEEIAALDRYYETTEITFRPAPNNRSYSGLAAACTPADPSNDEEHAPLEEAAADGIDAEEDVPRNLRDDESKCETTMGCTEHQASELTAVGVNHRQRGHVIILVAMCRRHIFTSPDDTPNNGRNRAFYLGLLVLVSAAQPRRTS
ncbi:hypothetical protein HYDPIDRAFT_29519 [Hydnomerulius pinastri MD-312]|uniref:Uncharacterized protein n=1 Tax=Hydnomerulius pinastri MD-312 TaxID=994086 RepID=A0A0C9WDQ4_9AGAM|nr:hypothetical protein HYDPIDRAFT_29519 [Hydnomerulius pinastri MD-312]